MNLRFWKLSLKCKKGESCNSWCIFSNINNVNLVHHQLYTSAYKYCCHMFIPLQVLHVSLKIFPWKIICMLSSLLLHLRAVCISHLFSQNHSTFVQPFCQNNPTQDHLQCSHCEIWKSIFSLHLIWVINSINQI